MEKIILASNNNYKIKEFKEMFSDAEVLALKDIGYFEDIVEDGNSFEENSLIKAKAVSVFLKEKGIIASVIADDSGLCVEALNGAPGIFSARYSGDHDFERNRVKLLEELKGIENRKAYFNCTLVELYPDGKYIVAEGRTYGTITTKEIGDNSFGYNCLFLSTELGKTFGEATSEERNQVSHRARAIEKLKEMRNNKEKQI